MAYNQNFYSNFPGNFTFQNQYPPLPTPPPPPVTPSSLTPHLSDQDFVKKFERLSPDIPKSKPNVNISDLKAKLGTLITKYNELSRQHKELTENVNNISEEEWKSALDTVSMEKEAINKILSDFNGSYMEQARKYLAKRTAKRLRLKRQREERKQHKIEMIKKRKENSRKIDEKIQKIKDDILKAKKEEDRLEADIVLKEVRRKKNDAKKCLAKLEALLKLRQARQNTAKGRGQNVSENEAAIFNKNIDKLKELWVQRLEMYEKEEQNLQAQLKKSIEPINDAQKNIESNIQEWKNVLFGGENPQRNFYGDIDNFVSLRYQWDNYINSEGSPLPVGWVVNV